LAFSFEVNKTVQYVMNVRTVTTRKACKHFCELYLDVGFLD